MPIKISKLLSDVIMDNNKTENGYYLHPIIDNTLKISWEVCDNAQHTLITLPDTAIDVVFEQT